MRQTTRPGRGRELRLRLRTASVRGDRGEVGADTDVVLAAVTSAPALLLRVGVIDVRTLQAPLRLGHCRCWSEQRKNLAVAGKEKGQALCRTAQSVGQHGALPQTLHDASARLLSIEPRAACSLAGHNARGCAHVRPMPGRRACSGASWGTPEASRSQGESGGLALGVPRCESPRLLRPAWTSGTSSTSASPSACFTSSGTCSSVRDGPQPVPSSHGWRVGLHASALGGLVPALLAGLGVCTSLPAMTATR